MLFVQLPSVIPCIDSISKKLFPFQEKVDHRGIRTPNFLIRSQTPYPLGHAAMHPVNQLYLLFVQLPSVIPCIDSISKKFPLCQAKSLRKRDSNPHSSGSKSDALSVGPCILSTVSVTCSVAKCCPLYRLDFYEVSFVSSKKSTTEGFDPPIF